MSSMSPAEYRAMLGITDQQAKGKGKRSKFNNTKVVIDGHEFDSKKEGKRYCDLRLMVRAGLITALRLQVSYVLAPPAKLKGENRTKCAMRYKADFVYFDNEKGVEVVEDVKSPATRRLAAYRQKKHLMKTVLNIDITEV